MVIFIFIFIKHTKIIKNTKYHYSLSLLAMLSNILIVKKSSMYKYLQDTFVHFISLF